MKHIYLYLLIILPMIASCTNQEELFINTENDSIPLSINSVILPNIEIGTRGSIWEANDENLGLAVYVYPENGYSEKLVYFQYNRVSKSWNPVNGDNINLGYGNAKLLVAYPVINSISTQFLQTGLSLSDFKSYLTNFSLKTTYYIWNGNWDASSSHLRYLASYAIISGVNKNVPVINNVNLVHAYAGLKLLFRREDTTIRYFKNTTVYNDNGAPKSIPFNFFTQQYGNCSFYNGDNIFFFYDSAVDSSSEWALCFFVAPTYNRAMTGLLKIQTTARFQNGTEETRTVSLNLSSSAYKNLSTFIQGKQHVITLTWK